MAYGTILWTSAGRSSSISETPNSSRSRHIYTDVIRGYHFTGDPRAFAILGRALPL